ncbi:phage baseplate assembly protein [Shigella sonnei]|nr:phage baseplate assembly protein V [Shigella sonnei]EKY7370449.1 phage baseplate assembly protein [Shigella sonnei]EME4986230.1 phage baseplate assembly protein [Shigella sonnei]
MWNNVDKRIQSALNGIRKAFRVVLTRVNSSGAIQTIQAKGLAGERLQDNELFQHYGFTSVPLAGSVAIVLPLNGVTSHGVIIATEHGRYRLAGLKPGEVALYTDEGARIVLKRGRIIETDCDEYIVNAKRYKVNATEHATFDTPELHGTGEVSDGKSTINAVRNTYNGHGHAHGGDAGTTQEPNNKM